jgi:hypothetical protein
VTNDNAPIYHGFWFAVGATFLQCEFGDGTGGDNPAFRRGKIVSITNVAGRWVHVSAVMRSTTDIDLYVNGINVGGPLSGDSNLSMASSYVSDKAKIGYFLSNGITYLFKGMIDEVRVWNRALTEDEVRAGMCKKLNGNESGLVGYWTFNETSGTVITDKSVSGVNGHFIGNPMHVFSGAAIGDRSIYSYSSSLGGNSFAIKDGNDSLAINNITGSPQGIQLYEVVDLPSQTAGLDLTKVNNPYFGVYLASTGGDNRFDVISCNVYDRNDNSIANWDNKVTPVKILQRGEFIDYGTNKPSFSFGADEQSCVFTPRVLKPFADAAGLEFSWQDGSKLPSFEASDFGTYWVTVSNNCGKASDTVRYTKIYIHITQLPNVITANGDNYNDFFEVQDNLKGLTTLLVINRWGKEVYSSAVYKNEWNGNDLDPGLYFIRLIGDCIGEIESPLTIIK